MKDRIDNILVKRGYFNTRQKAKYAIENKNIYVNGIGIEKTSKTFEEDCEIEVRGETLAFVSRGGLKLERAIQVFDINLRKKICMDIGASTGGFTDCMLQNGANRVYAVDVGHNQLDEKLVEQENVINLEGTNIKEIHPEDFEKMDFIAIDVSFISLTQVLDKAYAVLKEEGEMVILIKPQFEAGKEYLNKSGVVKNKKIHEKVIEKIMLYSNSLSFQIVKQDYSPIKGPAGNIEYIVYLRKKVEKPQLELFSIRENARQLVEKAHKELKQGEKS